MQVWGYLSCDLPSIWSLAVDVSNLITFISFLFTLLGLSRNFSSPASYGDVFSPAILQEIRVMSLTIIYFLITLILSFGLWSFYGIHLFRHLLLFGQYFYYKENVVLSLLLLHFILVLVSFLLLPDYLIIGKFSVAWLAFFILTHFWYGLTRHFSIVLYKETSAMIKKWNYLMLYEWAWHWLWEKAMISWRIFSISISLHQIITQLATLVSYFVCF